MGPRGLGGMTGRLGDARRVHPAAGIAGGVVATVTMDAAMVLAAWLTPRPSVPAAIAYDVVPLIAGSRSDTPAA